MVYQTILISEYFPIDKADVLNFLKAIPNSWIKSSNVSVSLNLPLYGNCITLRHIIAELIEEGHPIISSRNGYCYTDDAEQIDLCIQELQLRMEGIKRRIRGLQKSKNGENK